MIFDIITLSLNSTTVTKIVQIRWKYFTNVNVFKSGACWPSAGACLENCFCLQRFFILITVHVGCFGVMLSYQNIIITIVLHRDENFIAMYCIAFELWPILYKHQVSFSA